MQPHPDFVGAALPRAFALADFRLTPLSPDFTEEDYEAVMSSSADLKGFSGSWPEGLTLEDNRIDLAWHEREFTSNRSYSWIIRDDAGAYLGCFYIYPDIGGRGRAQAALWIRTMEERAPLARTLKEALVQWCQVVLPAQIALDWKCSPDVP